MLAGMAGFKNPIGDPRITHRDNSKGVRIIFMARVGYFSNPVNLDSSII